MQSLRSQLARKDICFMASSDRQFVIKTFKEVHWCEHADLNTNVTSTWISQRYPCISEESIRALIIEKIDVTRLM